MFRRTLIAAILVVSLAVVACGAASSTQLSPCSNARTEAVPSPDGTQIAYYGTRWPQPTSHGNPNSILQAFCVTDANGNNAQPLKYTVCSENCQDFPYQISWTSTGALLYVVDGPVLSLTPGSKPKKTGIRINAPSFSLDAAADRLASGANFPGCATCAGPVSVFDVSTGALVGKVGGKKVDNMAPSLSPDGSQVVFERDPSTDAGKPLGIWIAKADGSGLRRLESKGFGPLWSPAGNEIAYRTTGYNAGLSVVSPHGGRARTLIGKGLAAVYGWSPNGKLIAVETGSRTYEVAIVDVASGKVRNVFASHTFVSSAHWTPDSKSLIAITNPIRRSQCTNLYRVPAAGGKATLLRHC